MISVPEAKRLVRLHAVSLAPATLPLMEAAGCVLAADVFAPANIPLFAQAAMDGYAFAYSGWERRPMRVSSVVAAGDDFNKHLMPGEAVRIFTGAVLPSGADTVVMQEKTNRTNDTVMVSDEQIVPGTNVRPPGSEIMAGAKALEKKTLLVPGAIGFLATMGIDKIMVVPKPKIAILITGNELQTPGTTAQPGKVFEANSYSLMAALAQWGIKPVLVAKVADDQRQTETAIYRALEQADMVLLTGGVSVGDYDFVLPAAHACGVHTIFHKVAQKPGKPLFFGKLSHKLVFGLPGNPASVLTCFYQYVIPALEGLMQQRLQQTACLPLGAPLQKKKGLTFFLKGKVERGAVYPLPAQESFRVSAFAVANCIIEAPEEADHLEVGTPVFIYYL